MNRSKIERKKKSTSIKSKINMMNWRSQERHKKDSKDI